MNKDVQIKTERRNGKKTDKEKKGMTQRQNDKKTERQKRQKGKKREKRLKAGILMCDAESYTMDTHDLYQNRFVNPK